MAQCGVNQTNASMDEPGGYKPKGNGPAVTSRESGLSWFAVVNELRILNMHRLKGLATMIRCRNLVEGNPGKLLAAD